MVGSVSEGKEKSPIPFVILGVIILVGIILGIHMWLHSMAYESTDDAEVAGHIIQVSPKIAGQITNVYVSDNQAVKKGDLLVEIDPRDLQARVSESEAALKAAITKQIESKINVDLTRVTSEAGVVQESSGVRFARSGVYTAGTQVSAAASQVGEARAALEAAEADARLARADVKRYQELYTKDEISKQQLDQAVTNVEKTDANVRGAEKRVQSAEDVLRQANSHVAEAQAQVGQAVGRFKKADVVEQQVAQSKAQYETATAEIKQAQASLETAKLNLSYTKIYAPEAGHITNKSVEAGDYVQIGQALMSIVPQDVWVIANFKETQLARIKPGQPVDIRVDRYPNKIFRGRIDSIQSGTGAAFSLLPPENATGNYVKIVQRVPVKIVLDEPYDPNYALVPGMSVLPDVRVK